MQGETLPLYGDGRQMRDWLFVDDFCRAIWMVFTKGVRGQIYNVGAGNHITNAALSGKLVALLGADPALIRNVADRPGHDFCYAVACDKIRKLGWRPQADFDAALAETVAWYRDNPGWVRNDHRNLAIQSPRSCLLRTALSPPIMNEPSILVTGAGGLLGRRVVERAVGRFHVYSHYHRLSSEELPADQF